MKLSKKHRQSQSLKLATKQGRAASRPNVNIMEMFKYQINKGNLNDLVILPVSRFFDDIKLVFTPSDKILNEEYKAEVSKLMELGFVRMSGTKPAIYHRIPGGGLAAEYLTDFSYFAKPTKEVTDHIGNIDFSLSVTATSGDLQDTANETRNVSFEISMEGSTTGIQHKMIAGAVKVDELISTLENAECLPHMAVAAYDVFHRNHPNVKYTNAKSSSNSVTKSAANLFIAIGFEKNRSDLIQSAVRNKFDFFYTDDEQIEIVLNNTSIPRERFYKEPVPEEPRFQIVSYFGDSRINKGNIIHLEVLPKSKLHGIIDEAIEYKYGVMLQTIDKPRDGVEIILYISQGNFKQR